MLNVKKLLTKILDLQKNQIVTESHDLGVVSYSAGSIGSVSSSIAVAISKTGYTPFAVSVGFVTTSYVSFVPFMSIGKDNAYVHIVRRQSTAYSSTYHAYLYVTYKKN